MTTPRTIHALKSWPDFFEAVRTGRKTFEVRLNDRDFRVGDRLQLNEFDPETEQYSGRAYAVDVVYLLDGNDDVIPRGIMPDYVVMGIVPA